jgi:PAS domain S-box-containing protein
MRLGTMVAAAGYGAVGAIGWLDDGPEKVQDAAVSLILFAVFAVTLRRPQVASAVTLAVVWTELSFSTYSNGRVLVAATYVYPLLTLTAGLMFGGRAALAMWLACGLALPLLLYAGGGWGSDLSQLTASEAVALTVVEVVLAATAIITYVTLRAYFRVLESSERMRMRFVDLFEHAPDGLLAVDAAGRITEANELAERLLECDRARLVGLPLADAFVQAGADAQAIAGIGAASTPMLVRVGTKAAGNRTLEILAREVMGGFQLVLRNVTERRSAGGAAGTRAAHGDRGAAGRRRSPRLQQPAHHRERQRRSALQPLR